VKICIISSTVLPCLPLDDPDNGYNGLEQIVWSLSAGLARKGHEVLLVAPIGSKPPPGVDLHGTTRGESEDRAYSGYWQRLPDYQVIIDHSWQKWSYVLKTEGRLGAPILGVCHAPVNTMYERVPPVLLPCIVTISHDQAAHVSELWGVPARVAYNGIDLDFYNARGGTEHVRERYLFLARISTIKGPHLALDLARTLRFGLDIVGDDVLTGEPQLAHRVRALAQPPIQFHGPVSRARAVEFFSRAKALIHPAFAFREPFGLSLVEAQACGIPVITSDHGAPRETVKDRETGFVCKTLAEMGTAIRGDWVREIRPDACRANAERFSIAQMVKRYEELCTEALDTGGW
jgi:glycosyltransferase involved in cell wall biosynthesis